MKVELDAELKFEVFWELVLSTWFLLLFCELFKFDLELLLVFKSTFVIAVVLELTMPFFLFDAKDGCFEFDVLKSDNLINKF